MEVKCKKCHFKFQIPDVSGVREFHCVCPRCGMPFIYRIESDSVSDVGPAGRDSDEKNVSTSSHAVPETSFASSKQDLPDQAFSSNRRVLAPLNRPQTKAGGNLRQYLQRLLPVIILMAVVIVVYRFVTLRNEAALDKEVEIVDDANTRPEDISKMSPVDTLQERHLQVAPHWIQGSWILKTDDLLITTTINGQHIAERTDQGKTYYGVFYYHDGQLICNFDDGSVSLYRLDTRQHRIIIDDMYMEKVEN